MTQQPFTVPITRRGALRLLGAGGIGALLAACAGPGSTSGGNRTAPAPSATGGPVAGEISFAHWRAEDQEVLAEILAAFTDEYPDASVTQEISPSNDYQSTALQRLRSGNIGDLFTAFRGAQFTDMVAAGLFVDLTGHTVVDRYEASLISAGAEGETQYGLPYQLVFNQPVSNLDVLEAAGVSEPPADWDGWLAMCEAVRAAGLVPIAWPGGEIGNAGQLFNAMVMNNAPSEDMCTKIEEGEYKVTDDWFLTTLRQYAELRPYFQDNATGTAVEPAQQLFAQGDAAILATGSYHMAAVRGLGAQFPMGLIAPITVPADEAKYVGVHNATFILGVNSASENQAAAFALMEFLSMPQHASTYANGTAQHLTVKDVEYDNPDLAATTDWLEKETILAPRFQFNDLDIRNAAEQACIEVVGGASPEQAAEKAQQIIDQRVSA